LFKQKVLGMQLSLWRAGQLDESFRIFAEDGLQEDPFHLLEINQQASDGCELQYHQGVNQRN
jgi:hypothetical protein